MQRANESVNCISRRVRGCETFLERRARNNRELESHCAKCAIIIFLIAARTYTRWVPVLCYTFIILRHHQRERKSCQLCARARRLWKISHTRSMRSFCMEISIFHSPRQPARCDIFIDFHCENYQSPPIWNSNIGFTLYMPFFLAGERCWERQSCEETVSWVVMKSWVHSAGRATRDFNDEIRRAYLWREREDTRRGGNLNDKCALFGRIWLNKERIKSANWN